MRVIRLPIGRLLVACVVAVSASACNRGPDKDDKPAATSKTPGASRTAAGDPIVRVALEGQQRIGLQTQAATLQAIEPEVVAFGRLEEDPSRTFVVRAPVAGTLHFASGRDWPNIGQPLADGAVVGMLEPRLTTADRIALTNQLATAQSELSASTASVVAARAAYDRTKLLNADNKNISDRALEEAAARLAAEESRLKAATDTVRLLQESLDAAGPTANKALTVERGGDVVEILARPGEAVEPGTPILRVAKLDRLLARVDVPVGEHVPPAVPAARIVAVGYEDTPVLADRLGVAAMADPAAQGQSLVLRLRETRLGLRPGLAVTARIASRVHAAKASHSSRNCAARRQVLRLCPDHGERVCPEGSDTRSAHGRWLLVDADGDDWRPGRRARRATAALGRIQISDRGRHGQRVTTGAHETRRDFHSVSRHCCRLGVSRRRLRFLCDLDGALRRVPGVRAAASRRANRSAGAVARGYRAVGHASDRKRVEWRARCRSHSLAIHSGPLGRDGRLSPADGRISRPADGQRAHGGGGQPNAARGPAAGDGPADGCHEHGADHRPTSEQRSLMDLRNSPIGLLRPRAC